MYVILQRNCCFVDINLNHHASGQLLEAIHCRSHLMCQRSSAARHGLSRKLWYAFVCI